jgi:hypothetical protein
VLLLPLHPARRLLAAGSLLANSWTHDKEGGGGDAHISRPEKSALRHGCAGFQVRKTLATRFVW